MTKKMEDALLVDVAEIKNALAGTEYGPGLFKDHQATKKGMYDNKKEIARVKTIGYAISTAISVMVIGIGTAANWIKIFK